MGFQLDRCLSGCDGHKLPGHPSHAMWKKSRKWSYGILIVLMLILIITSGIKNKK